MKTSESIVNISKALLEIQNEFIVISKESSGQRNKYAKYDRLIRESKPTLTKAGLLLLQPLDHHEGQQAIRTRLIHVESGEYFESCSIIQMMDVKDKQGKSTINEAQQAGGGISYAKRYALASMLAWATGDYDFDQGTIDDNEEAKNAIIEGVENVMNGPDLIKYYNANMTFQNKAELTKACATRKEQLLTEGENANS